MTENELLTVIDVSHEDGVIESEEKETDSTKSGWIRIFPGRFLFAQRIVMVPRIDIEFHGCREQL